MKRQAALADDWRDIPGFPGYQANSAGQIKGRRGWVLSPSVTGDGYLLAHLQVDGRVVGQGVNRLVCRAFHGAPPSERHQAAHGDGDRQNNRPSNLRWATPAENVGDMTIHGTAPKGEKHGRALLTEKQVQEIRAAHAASIVNVKARHGLRRKLCAEYGVSPGCIKAVIDNTNWRA